MSTFRYVQALDQIDRVSTQGPFLPNWDSLCSYRVPDWYRDGKFGICMPWGIYSVPAFGNEWYARNMYLADSATYKHHIETYGPHEQFGYKDFIPSLTFEHYDPQAYARLFVEAGARMVFPITEHHDGFAMYHTSLSHWSAVNMGPRQDMYGNLGRACRDEGLTYCASNHRAEHWWFLHGCREIASEQAIS